MTGWGPFARILLRYGIGALMAYGMIGEELGTQIIADPDLVILLAALLGALVEGFYVIAKRKGWAT